MALNLTRVERQILLNQNRILSIIDEENRNDYELNIEILESGYELEYESVISVYKEVCKIEVCNETIEILDMFRDIKIAVDNLSPKEKEHLNIDKIKFEGFDAKNKHHSYAKFMIKKRGEWTEHSDKYLNSHDVMTIKKYRKMLTAMKKRQTEKRQAETRLDLNIDDLEYIINNC